VIVAGAVLSAGGVYYLSRIPLHGSYAADLLPGLVLMSFGLGAIFVGATVAANAGVPPDQAGLAAGLVNTSLPARRRRGPRPHLGDRDRADERP